MFSNSSLSSHYTSLSISRPISSTDPYNYTLNGQLVRRYRGQQSQSNINKLPGKKDVDMGKYPQMVILFQAAQIQRLNNVIATHRIQNKGVNKQHLDRHSYQVQIKELTTIIDEFKQQNRGYKKRIQQLNNAVNSAETKANNSTDIGVLANKYERALLEIGKMYDDNMKLQQEVNQLNFQLAELREKSKTIVQNTSKNLSLLENISEQQKNRLVEQETRHLRQQISQLQSRNSQTVLELRRQFTKELQQYKLRMSEKTMLKKQEIQQELLRATSKLQQLNRQLQETNSEKWALENRLRQNDVKLRQYEGKIRNHELELSKYTQQINLLNSRLNSLQNSAYFNQQNNISLTLSKSPQKYVQQSLSITQNINKQSLSITSSFNNTNQNQSHQNPRNQLQLQNNIAMLSQEVERLTEMVKLKNKEIQEVQYKNIEEKKNIEKELINIRIKYEGELRKQRQKRDQDEERMNKEIEKYRRKIQEWELSLAENSNKYKQQLLTIKEEERRICEAVYEKKLKSLELEYGRDRQQVTRLRKQVSILHGQIDILHQSQAQMKTQRRKEEIKYLQKIQEEERKYETKLKNLEEQHYKREEKRYNELKDKDHEEIIKLERKLHQQSELIRSKQLQHVQQLKNLAFKYEQSLKRYENERNQKEQSYQKMMREKERELTHLSDVLQSNDHQNSQFIRKQHQILLKKLDYLNQETVHAKNTIIEAVSYSKSNHLTENELSRIGSSLQYLSNQITTLSKQIMEAHFEHQQHIHSQNNYYSEQYVKQLQNQCDNYLSIINGKMSSSDSALRSIWEEIQHNNRYNREEQEKWRNAFIKQQQMLEQYQQQKAKWQQIRFESEKIKHDLKRLQQLMIEDNKKLQQQKESELKKLRNGHENELKNYHTKLQQLYIELNTKQNIICNYKDKFNELAKSQNEQLMKLTKIIEIKSKQLVDLSHQVGQYKNKYTTNKEKLTNIQGVIEKLLKESEEDIKNLEKCENENIQLRKQLQKINRQLQIQKDEKYKVIEKSRQQVRKITQKLTEENFNLQQFTYQQYGEQNNKILYLQRQFLRLQGIITQLKKDNYMLTKQNYNESTQDHVNREFALTKIRQLNKENERIMEENIELKDQISRCRLQFAGQWNQEKRYEENLSLFVLLFTEIEALRGRLSAHSK